jgi:hypothetical protein
LEDQGVDGRFRLEWILEILTGGVEWIQLAQDRGRVTRFCKYVEEPAGSGDAEFFIRKGENRIVTKLSQSVFVTTTGQATSQPSLDVRAPYSSLSYGCGKRCVEHNCCRAMTQCLVAVVTTEARVRSWISPFGWDLWW